MSFDPKPFLIKLPKRVKDPETNQWITRYDDYLEVKNRLVWFRDKFPHGRIETEEVCVDLDRVISVEVNGKRKTGTGYARFKARVEDGEGGVATGYGTENAAEFADFVERAETRSLGRALAALGIGTQFVGAELSEGEHLVDSPVITPVATATNGNGYTPAPVAAPASTNGHTPDQVQPKGAPKNLQQKSDLLRAIQDELARLSRPVGELPALCQSAFGDEVTTWELVCGESLHTIRHGLAYLKTLSKEVPSHGTASTPQPGTESTLSTIEAVPAVPQPAAPEPPAAETPGSTPADTPADTVEGLVAYAVSLGLKEDVTRRVIHLHKDLQRCRTILTDAAERNRRQVA